MSTSVNPTPYYLKQFEPFEVEDTCKRCGKEVSTTNTPYSLLSDLCLPCQSLLNEKINEVKNEFVGLKGVEKGMVMILESLRDEMGLELTDVNFHETPQRVARAYYEIFKGLKDTGKQVEKILELKFPSDGYNEMIVLSGIQCYSMCPHHFFSIPLVIDVGYIPSTFVLGLSKLARIVDLLSRRPVMQETLTKDIGKALEKISKDVAVFVRGEHYCMKMRGARKDATMLTSYLGGEFMDNQATRQEFFELLKVKNQ